MIHVLSLLLCLAGFAALACATQRQQDELFDCSLPRRTTIWLRAAGAGVLLLALAALLAWRGWGLGLVMYSGYTSLAAGLVFCALLVHRRRRARPHRQGCS